MTSDTSPRDTADRLPSGAGRRGPQVPSGPGLPGPDGQLPASGKKRTRSSASQLSRRRKSALEKENAAYAAQRQKIIASAADAFRQEGYDRTTLADIARRAGTDRASLYYYISNKEELFREVTSGSLEDNVAFAEETAARDIPALQKLELIIGHHMAEHERYPQTVLFQEMRTIADAGTKWTREVVARMRHYESIVMSILEEGIADGTIRGDVPPRLAMNAIFGMLNWTHRWFRPDGKYNAAAVAAAFTAITVDGLADGDAGTGDNRRPRRDDAAPR